MSYKNSKCICKKSSKNQMIITWFLQKFFKDPSKILAEEEFWKKVKKIVKIYTLMYKNIACNIIELICICKKSQNRWKKLNKKSV